MNFILLLAVSFAICDQSTSLNLDSVSIHSSVVPLPISSSIQHESIKIFESLTSPNEQSLFNSTEAVCQFKVSQDINGSFRTVSEALAVPCTESGGYEIFLLDSEHIEYLIVNQQSTILIKGKYAKPTIWLTQSGDQTIIDLILGNLTLLNIEFQYSLTNKSEQKLTPYKNLVRAESQDHYPILNICNCIFQSVPTDILQFVTQLEISHTQSVTVTNCTFNGVLNNKSTISMLQVEECKDVTLQGCIFQNSLISSDEEPIVLYYTLPNGSIVVQDCEFRNIHLENKLLRTVLKIYGESQTNVTLMNNTFSNCHGLESEVGALLILDYLRDNEIRYYLINNNTFKNNTGKFSGSIFLFSDNLLSYFSFNNNTFFNNSNNFTHGQDAFLNFSNPSYEWTKDNIGSIITSMFNGSTSDILNGSVYYEMRRKDEETVTGNITLPNPPSPGKKWYNNKYIIIGGACGMVILIIAVVIIIVSCVQCRKKKVSGSLDEKKSLLNRNKQESI